MKIEITTPDFRAITRKIEGDIAKAATGAMRATTPDAKQELRDQVIDAGLGAGVANAWRGDVYPSRGNSLSPAGYIHSRAPRIVDGFTRGATIVPINGSHYLAIPTSSVPRAPSEGRATRTGKMSPAQVEASFNQDLIVRPWRNGELLGFMDPSRTPGRRVRRQRGVGRAQLVLMFTFVPTVRLPRLLDLEAPAEHWAAAFADEFQRRLA